MKLAQPIGACAVLAVACVTCAQAQAAQGFDKEFSTLIASRFAAMARADTATVHQQLADDTIWVIGTTGDAIDTRRLLAAVSHIQDPAPRYDIDSVHERRFGNVAVVDYRRTDHRRVGSYEDAYSTRALEVFVRRRDHWLLTAHNYSWIGQQVTPVTMDSAALEPFIGHYEIGPGYVDNVHREGNALVATATGQAEGATLVPVSTAAFMPDGVGPLMVFERDATGRVLGYVQGLPDGRIVRARRLP